MRAACFGNNVFEPQSFDKCLSNLLDVGYRRLVVDLYWSSERRRWIFCPVSIPVNGGQAAPSNASTSDGGAPLIQLGPYSCSDDLDVMSMISVLQGFFLHTNAQFNVYTTYIIFNLHVAASDSAPHRPPPNLSGDRFPTTSLGYILDSSLDEYIYKPSQLTEERSNLNESWYKVDDNYKPIVQYFTLHENSDGTQSTPDGWPCSKYVQLAKQRRLLFGYGNIASQLGGYSAAYEDEVMFPPNYLASREDVGVSSNGTLVSGCLYNPGATDVSQANSSWAVSSRIPIPNSPPTEDIMQQLSTMVTNLTSCGLSPFLNTTVLNRTADNDIDTYRNISLSASWAWSTGEPHDANGPAGDDGKNRCAMMDLTLGGHWRAANCTNVRRTACRVNNRPFTWVLSNTTSSYFDAPTVCPDDTDFDVPRTGLENTYLFDHAMSQSKDIVNTSSLDPTKREIWLNFNSLHIASCWVTDGPEADCPYASDPQKLERRIVLVSTIAGIVICIVAALMLFVKCNANRRNSRRRRKVIEGWEYEGVPS